jgi:hypothetical protein
MISVLYEVLEQALCMIRTFFVAQKKSCRNLHNIMVYVVVLFLFFCYQSVVSLSGVGLPELLIS